MNLEKYSRNILLDEIDIKGQKNICNSSIMCIGCGGLAAFTLPLLVANGISKIGIIDFDTIEISNLPRQILFTEKDIGKYKVDVAKNHLHELNSNCAIDTFRSNHEIAIDILQKYDAIVDLTDSKTSRLFANSLSITHKKPFFTGAAIGFQGHVYSFGNHLQGNPCYECLFGSEDSVNICKADEQKTCGNSGVFAPAVSAVGSMIAGEILKYFAGINVDFTRFLFLDFLTSNRSIKMIKDPQCQCSKK